ncbi:MAG: hypothetical protein KKF46_06560 [Nanoarchaeota archaeon]|nr:hypothetical protein [Nanoarchaeota archaeon]MBU1321991.1 hypothetical protein [Nanoarchaeota archaeon]MBU1597981.1 hypothetical protein [Nanoarchaeota archaeon]MBU2441702.1 hypothetical protein [Nanoarchaeota archaeon]
MNKRNLILIALALTTLMVFTQIGAMAKIVPMGASSACILVGNDPPCSICEDYVTGNSCHAGTNCAYWNSCCNWAFSACAGRTEKIHDNSGCPNECCA